MAEIDLPETYMPFSPENINDLFEEDSTSDPDTPARCQTTLCFPRTDPYGDNEQRK
ncbi:6814_t:CDS:2 [Cetraspora pellucida]|uniref:6814_t:CDS:1 n=1 Tax=Cetraspora pellucida TaxID=1433469 RepID=A0A9N9EMD8_9GLOM|nr:6814_t:CDS:2 [Cetraspora pellucida]